MNKPLKFILISFLLILSFFSSRLISQHYSYKSFIENNKIKIQPQKRIKEGENLTYMNELELADKATIIYFASLTDMEGIADVIHLYHLTKDQRKVIDVKWYYSCNQSTLDLFLDSYRDLDINWIHDADDNLYEKLGKQSLILNRDKNVIKTFNAIPHKVNLYISQITGSPITKRALQVGDKIEDLFCINEDDGELFIPTNSLIMIISVNCGSCKELSDEINLEDNKIFYVSDYQTYLFSHDDFQNKKGNYNKGKHLISLGSRSYDLYYPSLFRVNDIGQIIQILN